MTTLRTVMGQAELRVKLLGFTMSLLTKLANTTEALALTMIIHPSKHLESATAEPQSFSYIMSARLL